MPRNIHELKTAPGDTFILALISFLLLSVGASQFKTVNKLSTNLMFTSKQRYIHRVSEKRRFFLLELYQISTNFNKFW